MLSNSVGDWNLCPYFVDTVTEGHVESEGEEAREGKREEEAREGKREGEAKGR